MTGVLELDRLQVLRRGTPLAAPLTLRCAPGTVLGLIGPNGAGKSSLLSAIAHTGIATTGAVRYDGRRIDRLSSRRRARLLSLLAQDSRAPGELRVQELVAVGAAASGRRSDPRVPLELLGISSLAARPIGSLSGGQRQLAQFARVLAQDTPVVLLDEPTSALDLAHQGAVEHAVRTLAERGRTVVVSVHDLGLALHLCTEVLLLDGRGGTHHGTPEQVIRPDLIHDVYGVRVAMHSVPDGRRVLTPETPPEQTPGASASSAPPRPDPERTSP